MKRMPCDCCGVVGTIVLTLEGCDGKTLLKLAEESGCAMAFPHEVQHEREEQIWWTLYEQPCVCGCERRKHENGDGACDTWEADHPCGCSSFRAKTSP